jgi:hypothetical protein
LKPFLPMSFPFLSFPFLWCLISFTHIECLHCLRTWNTLVGCYYRMPLPPSLTRMNLTLRGFTATPGCISNSRCLCM